MPQLQVLPAPPTSQPSAASRFFGALPQGLAMALQYSTDRKRLEDQFERTEALKGYYEAQGEHLERTSDQYKQKMKDQKVADARAQAAKMIDTIAKAGIEPTPEQRT